MLLPKLSCNLIDRECALSELIAGAAPTGIRFSQNFERQQLVDIAQSTVWRAIRDACPFATGEFSFETVEQFVEHLHLPRVQLHGCPVSPKMCFGQHGIERD